MTIELEIGKRLADLVAFLAVGAFGAWCLYVIAVRRGR